MNKSTLLIISIIALVLIVILVVLTIVFTPSQPNVKQYSCNVNSDCISQCANGCVNIEWAGLNPDITECFRAWDCSCVNKVCYTDGKPRN